MKASLHHLGGLIIFNQANTLKVHDLMDKSSWGFGIDGVSLQRYVYVNRRASSAASSL